MTFLDFLGGFKVGNSAGNLDDFEEGAGRESLGFGGGFKELLGGPSKLNERSGFVRAETGVKYSGVVVTIKLVIQSGLDENFSTSMFMTANRCAFEQDGFRRAVNREGDIYSVE